MICIVRSMPVMYVLCHYHSPPLSTAQVGYGFDAPAAAALSAGQPAVAIEIWQVGCITLY